MINKYNNNLNEILNIGNIMIINLILILKKEQ